ncbi:MAG: type I glutamate--ammonia ligase [Clostridia bacterium]
MNEGVREEIIRRCSDEDVAFVKLQFTDILGATKNVTIPAEQLPKALDGDIAFDGGSIEGFVRIQESDMLLKPDPNTFAVFPWSTNDMKTARLMCDITWPDGTPFDGCPRTILKRVLARAKEMGYLPNAGPEPEFFLFKRDEEGRPTLEIHDHAGYFDLPPLDRGEAAREDMVRKLTDMEFEVEAAHHEVAPAQHEIDFKYADAVTTADRIATFRFVVRTVALQHNLHATFMPKPKFGIPGSGMHVHLSLFEGERNAFYDGSKPESLATICYQFLAGVMRNCREFTAVTNPLVNSYKRLVPGFEAPVYIAWSLGNRSPLIRVPARRGIGTRLEVRSPDPACNPYLALAVIIAAGLDGIEESLEAPDPVDDNIYEMSLSEREKRGIGSLPGTLAEALAEMEDSELVRRVLGDHITDRFIAAKKLEWDEYRTTVHGWELDRYLGSY